MKIFIRNKISLLFSLVFLYTTYVNANDLNFEHAGEPLGTEILTLDEKGLGFTGGKSILYVSRSVASSTSIYSNDSYAYGGAGCITNNDPGSIYFDTNLMIPGGSIIVSATLLYNNTGGGNLSYDLYNTNGGGEYNVVSSASIPAATGYNNIGTFLWLEVTSSDSYLMRANINNGSGKPCLFRVGYIPADIASDVIFVNNFFR